MLESDEMYRITDKDGNAFYTEDHSLACAIVDDKNNPFNNLAKTNDKVAKRHILKSIEEFEDYFY